MVRAYAKRSPLSSGEVRTTVQRPFYQDFTEGWTHKKWEETTDLDQTLAANEILDRLASQYQHPTRRNRTYVEALAEYENFNEAAARSKWGLDTTANSRWSQLRMEGKSDKLAQYSVYKERGLI